MEVNGITPKEMDAFYEIEADEPVWYVFRDERHFGPFSIQWLQELLALGVIHENHHVWQPKLQEWKSIREFENLRSYANGVSLQDLTDDAFESILQAEEMKLAKKVEIDEMEVDKITSTPVPAPLMQDQNLNDNSVTETSIGPIYKQPKQVAGVLAILILVVAWAGVQLWGGVKLSEHEQRLLSSLSPTDKARAKDVLKSNRKLGFDAHLFSLPNQTSLIVVSNLEDLNQEIAIEIKGIDGRLVGYQRWADKIEVKPDGRIFEIENSLLNVPSIPEGEFQVRISKGADSALSRWSNIPDGLIAYKKKLGEYEATIESQKILEHEEVLQVQQKLQEHLEFTLGEFEKFRDYPGSARRSGWKQHVGNWRSDQARFDRVFASLKDPNFVNRLFYAKEYLELMSISAGIASIQKFQEVLMKEANPTVLAKSSGMVREIQARLNELEKRMKN